MIYHFSLDDSSSDTSSGSSLSYSPDTSSCCSLLDFSFDTPVATSARPSCKKCRSFIASATPILGALSSRCADLLSPHKRTSGSISASDHDGSTESSYETYTKLDIDFDVQVDIDACITAANAVVASEADARVEVDTRIDKKDKDEEEVESSHRGTVEIGVDKVVEPVVSEDTHAPTDDESSREVVQIGLDEIVHKLYDYVVEIPVSRIVKIKREKADYGRMVVIACKQRTSMCERIHTLERDNTRLRTMLCIERERIDSLRRHMAYMQEEFRQIRQFRYYDRMEFRRLETYARRRLDAIDELIAKRVAKSLVAYDATRNPRPEVEIEEEQGDDNGNNNGNGNENGQRGNGNGIPNVNTGAYTQRFQELVLLCTKMVPEEEDRVEKFIGGLSVSLTFSEAGILHVNWTSLRQCMSCMGHLCKL
nr:hypothetical protein [Tanacetum cinerariifolium]